MVQPHSELVISLLTLSILISDLPVTPSRLGELCAWSVQSAQSNRRSFITAIEVTAAPSLVALIQ